MNPHLLRSRASRNKSSRYVISCYSSRVLADPENHGTKILGITTKYVQDHRAQEAPNTPIPAGM